MTNMSRRVFLKKIYHAMVVCGAAQFISFSELLKAADKKDDNKPYIIWLHGTSCSGCSTSFLDLEGIPVVDIITKFSRIMFHPDLSLATGNTVIEMMNHISASNIPYILVVEGGIPVELPHACLIGDKPFKYWVSKLASGASACVGAGTCATLGGIPAMHGTDTGSVTLQAYLESQQIKSPVINIPSCPMRPEHLAYTLLHIVYQGTPPKLDKKNRPIKFFGSTVHERCVYYADYQEDRFATRIGESGCLLKLGCQGPVTRNDCLINGHNGNTNTCIRAGHPCIGCASEHFPRRIMLHSYNDKRAMTNKKYQWRES